MIDVDSDKERGFGGGGICKKRRSTKSLKKGSTNGSAYGDTNSNNGNNFDDYHSSQHGSIHGNDMDKIDVEMVARTLEITRQTGLQIYPILILEIKAHGENRSRYLQMTPRELMHYIDFESNIVSTGTADIPGHTQHHVFPPTSPDHVEAPPAGPRVVTDLRLRDVRHLDFQFNASCEPSIIIRRNVVLLAIDPIRACIMHDRLLLIVPDGADSLLQTLESHMETWQAKLAPQHIPASSVSSSGAGASTGPRTPLYVVPPESFECHAYEGK